MRDTVREKDGDGDGGERVREREEARDMVTEFSRESERRIMRDVVRGTS